MACDLCGKQGATVLAKIEGVAYRTCAACSEHGTVIQEVQAKKKFQPKSDDRQVVSDAGSRIRTARESKGEKQKEFAQSIGVKESLLHAWESQHQLPTIKEAEALQKKLHISLFETSTQEGDVGNYQSSGGALTIGDMLKKKS